MVEDESQIAILVEAMLEDLGCTVAGAAWRLPQAVDLAQTCEADFALLDVNLAGERVFPVAEVLKRRQIPFVFATGYGSEGLPAAFKPATVLAKPFRQDELRAAIEWIMGGG